MSVQGPPGPAPAQPPEPARQGVRIELRPRCSLSPQGARCFFAVTCVIILGTSAIVALSGAWPALIFAVLELLAIRWALQLSLDRGQDREVIEITEDEVHVAVSVGATRSSTSFTRHWAQVRLQPADSRLHPSRLLIESHGRHCELGAFLTEEERCQLATRLKRLIGRTCESPSLPFPPRKECPDVHRDRHSAHHAP